MRNILKIVLIMIFILVGRTSAFAYTTHEIDTGCTIIIDSGSYADGDTINVNTTQQVTFWGTKKVFINVTVTGANIAIYNANIDMTGSGRLYTPAIKFTGSGNTLTIKGTNTLKGNGNSAIEIDGATELTIKGDASGTLTATGGGNSAGIGSSINTDCGVIIIESGTINAFGSNSAAGIGSGANGDVNKVEIKGGTVTATGGANASGIGGGSSADSGSLIISGTSDVTAIGGEYASGIGGGKSGNAETITISDTAKVTSTGGEDGAGIGGGSHGAGGTITISGGTINATGKFAGAGIGGGLGGDSGTINISGGEITASSDKLTGYAGNGIGSGASGKVNTITISGTAIVNATSGMTASGIGGDMSNGGIINIVDGTVVSNGGLGGAGIGGNPNSVTGGNINISGGDITAIGYSGGAGIGSDGNGGAITVNITGGVVKASSIKATDSIGDYSGAGIGGGHNVAGGTVIISGDAIVYAESGVPTENGHGFAQDIGYGTNYQGSTILASGSLEISDTSAVFLKSNTSPSVTTTTHLPVDNTMISANSAYGVTGFPSSWNGNTAYGYMTANTVFFDKNTIDSVSNMPSAQVLAYNGKITQPAAPTRIGYTIDGWYKEYNYINEWDFDNDVVTENITLFAKWKPNIYYVKFYGNTHTAGSMSNQALTYDLRENLAANSFIKDGYTFDGWFYNPACTGQSYTDVESVLNLTTDDLGVIELYAKWIPSTYSVEFNGNGSTSGSMTNQSFTYNVAQPLADNTYAKTDYEFVGWNTDANGNGDSYSNMQSVSNLTTQSSATVTLYAQWKIVGLDVIYNANNGINAPIDVNGPYDTGDTITVLDGGNISRLGYEFTGWNTERDGDGTDYDAGDTFSMPSTDVILFAQWTSTITTNTQTSSGSTKTIIQNEYTTEIPSSIIGKNKVFSNNSDGVKININGLSLSDYKGDDVELFVQKIDSSYFNLNLKGDFPENMPVFDISLIVDGMKVPFESDIPIEIEFEVAGDFDNHKMVAIYITEEGDYEILEGIYDGKVMRFTTNHLSNYALMYVDKTFNDITTHWSKEAVEALASREIIKGKSETVFAPDVTITRAEFVTLMVRYFDFVAFGTDLGYTDVDEGTWYTQSVLTARELNILPEIYGDIFEPTKEITRVEMMYILYKSILLSGKTLDDEGLTLDGFTDKDSISDYALEASEYLVSRDIIHGSNNKIKPNDTTTRAEVAQMLYNMLIKQNIK